MDRPERTARWIVAPHARSANFESSPCCGDEEIRTPDFLLAKEALYQLSYVPWECLSDSLLAHQADDGDVSREAAIGPGPPVGEIGRAHV